MDAVQQNIYVQRVNRVLDYITTHLDEDLSLALLADVAGFSEFHFHRIFKTMVGETLSQFVWRIRLERGAVLLRADPKLTVSEAANRCGFSSLAGFSRAFKARFSIAPTQWNRQTRLHNEPNSLSDGLPIYHVTELQSYDAQFPVTLRKMPAQRLAYLRVHDSYSSSQRIEAAYHNLIDWYLLRGGQISNTTLYGMSMDDPDITPPELCRFDWCLRVPDDWQGGGDVSVRDFPECLLAIITLDDGDLAQEDRTLQYFWRYWLPRSDYQPANLPTMEIYHQMPHEVGMAHWWDHLYLDCAVPVVGLATP